ncbi:PH domain-containing protein [Bifidobacterium platyrrhinorum]|uniref:PH domain-containing protein n=1 Tax=Bifidobacterium platyrrhinorum TaxID=2661628 RepID=A0A6L9SWM2_9BIFI|nr:PH domain-containing protein [Bifidobacterium platyrrhinorum]NEG55892.1 PH domain-containing protein [Bifidobacterium platyrrhinorum]
MDGVSAARVRPESDARESSAPDGPDGSGASRWRRLHPAALIVRIVSNVKGTVSLLLSFIVIVRASLRRGDWWLWACAAAIVMVVVVRPLCAWLTTRYRLTADALEYRSGLFLHQRRTISYGAIHAVNSAQPVYLRPFGIVRLTVSSVGADADITLDAVPAALQLELERLRAGAREDGESCDGPDSGPGVCPGPPALSDSPVAAPTATATPETAMPRIDAARDGHAPVFRASTHDILLFAVTDLGFVAAAFVAFGFVQNLQDMLPRDMVHGAERSIGDYASRGVLAVVLLASACLLAIVAVSVVTSLLRFHGFEVWRRGDDLVVVRGLFTRRTTAIPVGRIQTIVVQQSVLRRPFRLCSVRLGLSATSQDHDVASATIVLPVIGTRRVVPVLRLMLPEWDAPDELGMARATRVPKEPRHDIGSWAGGATSRPRLRCTGRDLLRYYLTVPCFATITTTSLTGIGGAVTHIWPWWLLFVPLAAGVCWISARWLKSRNEGYLIVPDIPDSVVSSPGRSCDGPDERPLRHRIIVTGARGWGLFAMLTRRARVQSVTRTTALWRESRGVEGLQMSLFVMNGISDIRFRFLHRDDAEALESWFTGR